VHEEDLIGDLAEPHHRSAAEYAGIDPAGAEHDRADHERRDRGVEKRLGDRNPGRIRADDVTADRRGDGQ